MRRALSLSALGITALLTFNPLTAHAFGGLGGGTDPHQGAGAGPGMGQSPISGKVVETMDAGGYTYVKVEDDGKSTWVAVPQMKVKKGDEMVFAPGDEMANFKSKSLGRTFERIIFSPGPATLPGTKADRAKKAKTKGEASPSEKIKVEKAAGAGAYSVAELYGKSGGLDGKEVVVRGKVVKVSKAIMGKNWIHLQDGTGDPGKGTNNIVATSDGLAEVGDTVTVSGTLVKDKDFGYGYKYDAIIENAVIGK